MITRQEFKKALNKIGFDINSSPNGRNDFILNEKGKKSKIRVLSSHLEVRSNHLFGESFNGDITFYFDCCRIEHDKENNTVNLISNKEEGIYISFHNFK